MPSIDEIYADALVPFAASFSPNEMMARAETVTRLADWGGDRWAETRFRERFAALCDAFESDAKLNVIGRSRAHSRAHVMLCSRLRQVDYQRSLDGDVLIAPPLVGTGLPRAGTTFLHGLLACDPDNISATAAQAAIPVPPPGADGFVEADRIGLYARILDFQGFTTPDVTAIHPYDAGVPEECVFIQEAACGSPIGAFYYSPGLSTLSTSEQGVADAYAWQKGMMKTIESKQPGKRWLLKTPSHIINIGALASSFPDARVFLNHRDPGKVIPSMASLYMKLYSLASDDSVDPKALGLRLVTNWAKILDDLDDWRTANPQFKIVDVQYSELIAEPIAQAERLYEEFGLSLTDAARSAMQGHLTTDRHGKGPARVYSLEDFGLTEVDIENAFGAYIDRRGVKREKRA